MRKVKVTTSLEMYQKSEEDILESAGAASSPLEIPDSVDEAELRDLKEQFQMQDSLLGQLKGVLRSNEEKLQTKEKEVQDYASRLARARLHSKAKDVRLRSLETSMETRSESVVTSTPVAGAAPMSGKMKLLKMQLDELQTRMGGHVICAVGVEKRCRKEIKSEGMSRSTLT